MGLLSKIASGLKKVVKKVAKGVKKVAKGVVTAIPMGQKIWKTAGKIGTKVMEGIGKLGPVAIIAAQVLLSVTGVGAAAAAALGSMWSGFGAVAASAAANGGLIASTLGNIGTAIFNAGNFIGGTLGAMGNAITEGGSQLLQGNIAGASEAFMSNMTSALSGEAGMGAMNAAAAQAAEAAGINLGSIDASTAVQNGVSPDFASEHLTNGPIQQDFQGLDLGTPSVEDIAQSGADAFAPTSLEGIAQEELYGKAGGLTFAENGVLLDHGADGVKALQPGAPSAGKQIDDALNEKVESTAKNYLESYLNPQAEVNNGEALGTGYKAKAINASKTTGGGTGSEGFSLLKGVRGLEESVRNSQSLMFS